MSKISYILIIMSFFNIFAANKQLKAQTDTSVQNENSILWKVSGKRLKSPSYLYGTIHIQDKRVFSFDSTVLKTLLSCDAFAMELILDEVNQEELTKSLFMEENLTNLLSTEDYTLLSEYFTEKTGMGITLYNKMKPFFIMSLLQQQDLSKEMELPLDMYFLQIARENNLKTLSVEKLEDQFGAIDGIPIPIQTQLLMKTIKDTIESEIDPTQELISAYLKQDLVQLDLLINESMKDDTIGSALFMDKMLISRNTKMCKQFIKFSKKQSTFVAVGAAHLGANYGIIKLLRDKGYTVEPVRFEFVNEENIEDEN